MHYKQIERLKELAFTLSALSAEIVAVFAAEDRTVAENVEAQKKIPRAALCRSLGSSLAVK